MPRTTLFEQPAHPPVIMYDNPNTFHVEDFFNLDLLSAGNDDALSSASASASSSTTGAAQSHGASSSSSRASSEAGTDSPTGSLAHLQTPPQVDAPPTFDIGIGMPMNIDMSSFGGLPAIEEESIFTSGIGSGPGDFYKAGTDPLASMSHSPFDLFGPFDTEFGGGATSSEASTVAPSASSSDNNTSFPFNAIDPQLVGTSTASTSTDSPSDVGAEPDSDEEDSRGLVIAPVKVGGKGKARRGTLQSGGVVKKSSLPGPQSIFGSLSVSDGPSGLLGKGSGKGAGKSKESSKPSAKKEGSKDIDQDNDDEDADDWRPSPEEYAKMSSKEKRQLRNKISARNFRIRRKEYIHTLEGDIADRDRLIDAIRSELGSTKSENSALRQEVATLKKAILEGRASPMLPPPAPLSPLSPLSSFTTLPVSASSSSSISNSNGSGNNLIKPNTHKDLPTSPRLGASPFWGGQAGGFGSFGGGITPVHTAIIPETAASVFGADRQKENINPALNAPQQNQPQQQQVMSQVLAQLYGSGANDHLINNASGVPNSNVFDSFGFADVNPFTLKTLDAYRMQLWGRVAIQAQRERAVRPSSNTTITNTGYPSPHSTPADTPKSQHASVPLSGLASSLRPQYFASANTNATSSPSSPTAGKPFGALLSGKGLPYGHSHHAHHPHGLPSPPPSPRMGEKERAQQTSRAVQQQKEREQAQTHALLATLASQTVLQKMGHAFWDAFSGASSSSGTTAATPLRAWDSEKVRKVLEGSAVLRVVDVERVSSSTSKSASTSTQANNSSASADALADGLRGLSLDAKQEQREDGERKSFFARMNCSGCSKKL